MKRLLYLVCVGMLCFLPWNQVIAGDTETLVVVQEAEPLGLDLMRSSIQTTMSACYNIHETLFHPQEDASVKPALAEKWERIDALTWKIHLRKDATFHNGEPVTAEAVKFSFNRGIDPDIQSPHKGKLDAFDEVKVLDRHTFTIKTKSSYAPGLYILGYYLPIVPPGYINEVGNTKYNTDPVGAGPYQLKKWVRGQKIIFERYENYYGPKPYYKTVVFKGVPEEASRIAALMTGEADIISGISFHQREKIQVAENAYLTSQMGVMPYLGINTYEKPFNDVRVRQALNYSINRELINKGLFQGKAIICNGPISPRTFGSNPHLTPYPYDPEKSQKLLADAGYPNGIQARLAYPTYMSQIQEQAEVIANSLAVGGIEVTLEPYERAVMWERYKGQKHQLYIYWWDDAPEPDRYIYSLFHSESRDYYYKNPTVDVLLDLGRKIMNREDRAKVYHEIDRLLYEDCPWAFLYVIPDVFGVSSKVDYQGRRDGFLNMRYAKPKQ
ncbi:MAG: ABC transporter substrate-binding protein [Desulfovermiculus sp.]|nr:ABC transporter substrate-binding protein [Desulfovermiculus sp.]